MEALLTDSFTLAAFTKPSFTPRGGGGGGVGDARRLALGCKLWSHLGCLGWKVNTFTHSGIA